tara:strand:+ start:114708 stop:115502 length:795 start_codon:yes stop_codon:yes gene_type:complete
MTYRYVDDVEPESLPANIKLYNAANLDRGLDVAESALKDRPVNVCVVNHFKDAAFAEYLEGLVHKNKLPSLTLNSCEHIDMFEEELSAYFDIFARKVPLSMRNENHDAVFRRTLLQTAKALFRKTQDHKITLEIRVDKPDKNYYIHIDGGNVSSVKDCRDKVFFRQNAKVIMNLVNTGTALFDNQDVLSNIARVDQADNDEIKTYKYYRINALSAQATAWYAKPLSLVVFPCETWSHEPLCHSKAIKEHSKDTRRANAIFYIEP